MIVMFVLVAISVTDTSVAKPATQTLTYHSTAAECQTELNRIYPTVNKSYVRLDCVPLKIREPQ
jgi:hypothetical protein